jgi:hypothetical protein
MRLKVLHHLGGTHFRPIPANLQADKPVTEMPVEVFADMTQRSWDLLNTENSPN